MEFNSNDFPNLHSGNYQVRRPPNKKYNCIPWAAGRDDQWWEPTESDDPEVEYYWPEGTDHDGSLASLVMAYESVGFVDLTNDEKPIDGTLEVGIEKIALCAIDDEYTHTARQLENGKWTSKIGKLEVIEHDAPEDVNGPAYGQVAKYMQRKRP